MDAAKKAGLGQNFAYNVKNPGTEQVEKLADVLTVSPGWLAYNNDPEPVPPPNGFHAQSEPLNQPDNVLGAAYAAYKADGGKLEARFFDALEMLGLLEALYLIRCEAGELYYDHIGAFYRKTLGWCWWVEAHGKRVADDPDQAFAHWSIGRWQRAMQREEPFRDRCLVSSRYTGTLLGWPYDTLVMPIENGLIVLNEVVK